MADRKQLERDASSAEPKAIRALFKEKHPDGLEGRDPQLYPWAGDRWRRLHWAYMVIDPAVMIPDKGGKERRHVRIAEGFAAKNEKGRVETPRDGRGKRIPPVQKDMPWPEWMWLTSTGGFPQKMRGYRANRTPAQCFHQTPAETLPSVPTPPEPPAPPPPPQSASEALDAVVAQFMRLGMSQEAAERMKEAAKVELGVGEAETPNSPLALPPPPPPPPGAVIVPPPPPA